MNPTLFVSHGSPMHALHPGGAGVAWAEIARRLPRPRAVLIASAHWDTRRPMLTGAARPQTLHDFGGFPAELYRLDYPAPGAPELARRALDLLQRAGQQASIDDHRGLDHGAWVPLMHMYPDADVPTVQVSIQTTLGPAQHLALGAALAPLAAEEVLIIGSGHMTHNLGEWVRHVQRHGLQPADAGTAPYVDEFRRAVDAALRNDDRDVLAHFHERVPHALRAHPSDDHFVPLLVAFAAAGERPGVERVDVGVDAGVLAMDAYLFGAGA